MNIKFNLGYIFAESVWDKYDKLSSSVTTELTRMDAKNSDDPDYQDLFFEQVINGVFKYKALSQNLNNNTKQNNN